PDRLDGYGVQLLLLEDRILHSFIPSFLALLQEGLEVRPVGESQDEGGAWLAPFLPIIARLQSRTEGFDRSLRVVPLELQVGPQVEEVGLLGGPPSGAGDGLLGIGQRSV